MDPLTLGAIGVGAGLLKSQFIDKPRERRQRRIEAAKARYSPWTNMQAGDVKEADPFGSALQFGATGLSMGQNMERSEQDKLLRAAQLDELEAKSEFLRSQTASRSPNAVEGAPYSAQQPGMPKYWLSQSPYEAFTY